MYINYNHKNPQMMKKLQLLFVAIILLISIDVKADDIVNSSLNLKFKISNFQRKFNPEDAKAMEGDCLELKKEAI